MDTLRDLLADAFLQNPREITVSAPATVATVPTPTRPRRRLPFSKPTVFCPLIMGAV